eukprot:gene12965-biopygen3372
MPSCDLVTCRNACAANSACGVMQWQGTRQNNFSASLPGSCFLYAACDKAKEYDTAKAHDFCMQIERCSHRPTPPGYGPICSSRDRTRSVHELPRDPTRSHAIAGDPTRSHV